MFGFYFTKQAIPDACRQTASLVMQGRGGGRQSWPVGPRLPGIAIRRRTLSEKKLTFKKRRFHRKNDHNFFEF